MTAINQGEKLALYGRWQESYKNIWNLEYWYHNKMKAYIYAIGLISVVFLPLVIIMDCFFPLLGRSPNSKPKK